MSNPNKTQLRVTKRSGDGRGVTNSLAKKGFSCASLTLYGVNSPRAAKSALRKLILESEVSPQATPILDSTPTKSSGKP
jgi:hypothetical protein